MGFSDFFRGGRDRPHRDEQYWQDTRSRYESRNIGRPNYRPGEQGFEGRGSQRGSDFYGDNPERYAEGGWDAVRAQDDDPGSRSEYRGSSSDWGRQANRYGGEFSGSRQAGSSFNDRWQNSYGGSGYGGEQSGRSTGSFSSGHEGLGREDERWWNEMSGRPGGGMNTQTGSFRGRGPKGYRRSDDRIRDDVCECLTEDERIDATNIQVVVKECEVTLTGTVNSREEKRRAEDLIEQLSGVKDVHNTLRVNEGGAIASSTSSTHGEQSGSSASQPGSSSATQSGSSSGSQSDETTSRH
jgi:osmotically-inducible protein OsmY